MTVKTAREQLDAIADRNTLEVPIEDALLDLFATIVAEVDTVRGRLDVLEYGSRKRVP